MVGCGLVGAGGGSHSKSYETQGCLFQKCSWDPLVVIIEENAEVVVLARFRVRLLAVLLLVLEEPERWDEANCCAN